MIIYIAIFTALLGFKLWWDYRAKNVKKRTINHARSAIIDTSVYLISAVIIFGWDAGGWILFALGSRWILFDLCFNTINGDKWSHYGTSSKLDLFMKKCGKWHIAIKIIPFIIGYLTFVI